MRYVIFTAFILVSSCSNNQKDEKKDELQKAIDFIFSIQKSDGSFRSELNVTLSSGQTITPFVLYSLSFCNPSYLEKHKQSIAKGVNFIKNQIGPDGGIGFKTETPEYPTYAMSLTVLALRRIDPSFNTEKIIVKLKSLQLVNTLGWDEKDPEYGSFDYGGPFPKKPYYNRPDISKTAFAIEAINDPKDESVKNALKFVRKCCNKDGGFFFTTSEREAFMNKAGIGVSYGTTTCDGVRALVSAGIEDETLKSALNWLKSNLSPEIPGGFKTPEQKIFAQGMFFYWSFIVSWVHLKFKLDQNFIKSLRGKLISLQKNDGSFQNEFGIMKEDDILIATPLAIIALSNLK